MVQAYPVRRRAQPFHRCAAGGQATRSIGSRWAELPGSPTGQFSPLPLAGLTIRAARPAAKQARPCGEATESHRRTEAQAEKMTGSLPVAEAPSINLDRPLRFSCCYSETRVPRTSRNNARNFVCTDQAKLVTRLPSRIAPSGEVSTYSLPARRTSGAQAA